jgi:FtsP/CotA-like multicopper oxidase with cupredoxin domain
MNRRRNTSLSRWAAVVALCSVGCNGAVDDSSFVQSPAAIGQDIEDTTPSLAPAVIDGVEGTSFTLAARPDYISLPDGGSLLVWGYGDGARAQYPGPTLIVDEGDQVTVTLTSELTADGSDVATSIVFPGQVGVTASGGSEGLLTRESTGPGDPVSYTFIAHEPGTYMYHSGTRPDLQVEMGLVGALIVRPGKGEDHAYNHPDTEFDHEYLFMLTEMDPNIHHLVAEGRLDEVDTTERYPVYWFVNGRAAPDTLAPANAAWLPTQPYNALVRARPGERVLMRLIGAGSDLHPFHFHGNNAAMIARDGRLRSSGLGAGPDLAYSDFTFTVVPGGTYDAIFSWTGEKLGWDIYDSTTNHECTDTDGDDFDDTTYEYCPDHGKPFPVELPEKQQLAFGGFYSGSPFLGSEGSLPPGEGGMNPYSGFFYMWHSHLEKEMTNFNVFPGGMMTMMVVEPPGTPIP